MSPYQQAYRTNTGKPLPAQAATLEPLFAQIAAGEALPPRGQQAVTLGLTAHSLTDAKADPDLFEYYRWVITHCFAQKEINELTAKLIGMAFTSANIFQTDLPQPITLNPWQIDAMLTFPLATKQAVVIENNGVFALLHQRHPTWPLIVQSGNDFNPAYVQLIQNLEQRGVAFTYIGDLDSRGIQMADHFFTQLQRTPIDVVTALQRPVDVAKWVALMGKPDPKRTRALTVQNAIYQQELNVIQLSEKFVEQEQLLAIYEARIPQWLAENKS
ncbi:hypothetical protein FC83_GL000086 [Agrilactobacillus composti DSM 18527 = JCM 14202]|uniref:DUF2399 domain-containing protein n=1 Tax=Agrilactobacillus composti DSM 18527 = JCM 14202 TaxID=1423734 RepID=X0QSD7_9LACO|nr:DUF2399 domain-containing protein [Agrilactobacillus composti]KRM32995.1 hypothetical protein FC83_GL000086 [Agrilactobacillus composti DSM 18527 = JCM 14202]GAF41495.1 hypothetical protein JCM14202_3439 [Agrilactobacillus composti DSM 18527 = JCM 14202]